MEMFMFATAPRMMGRMAMTASISAPVRVVLEMIRLMKSEVGFPGRMPGMAPLFLRMLLAISMGLYWIAI